MHRNLHNGGIIHRVIMPLPSHGRRVLEELGQEGGGGEYTRKLDVLQCSWQHGCGLIPELHEHFLILGMVLFTKAKC